MRIVIILSLMGSIAAAAPHEFHVAVEGDNANTGALEAPFAAVHRARDAVRALIASGLDGDVTVYIHGGVHFLEEPLTLTSDDSGTVEHKIVYRAYGEETPVLSGGRAIGAWTREEGDRWTLRLPDVASGAWHFRQLFREGVRLPRARFPKGDAMFRVTAVDASVTNIDLDAALPEIDFAANDAELVVYQNWSITRMLIVSGSGSQVRVLHPAGWIGHGDMTTTSPGKPCYLEHAMAWVAEPGEWHLDRGQGLLTYMASPGENPNEAMFIAPRLERLLDVCGSDEAPVRNVHFIGLTFAHTEWPLPDSGYAGIQAGHYGPRMDAPTHVLPGAAAFRFAESCRLEDCRIVHTGASGLVFGAACRDNEVVQCILEDIGGSGIMMGWRGGDPPLWNTLTGDHALSADWLEARYAPRNNTIRDCVIRRCAAVNLGCVGIYDGFCDGTRILNNHVTDLPYTGISIGFRWDEAETSQRNCVVEGNHVHDVMKVLADGGAIYTLGFQPGTTLRNNLLHDVHRSKFAHGGAPNNGIFFDQGSKGYLVEGNIIYNTSGEAIRFNQTGPDNMTFVNNSFGLASDHPDFPAEAAARLRKK